MKLYLLSISFVFGIKSLSLAGGFVTGQKVLTVSGEIPIELINKQTKIIVYQNQEPVEKKGKIPEKVQHKNYGIVELSDLSSLALTADTELYLVDQRKWQKAQDLKVGDLVQKRWGEDEEKLSVTSVSSFNDDMRTSTVYRLDHKAFFVHEILVK